MSYSEVRTTLEEVRSQIADVNDRWVQHLRRASKTTPSWACAFCLNRRIFTSSDSLWEHAQLDHLELLVEEEQEEELLLQWRYLRHLELLLLRLLQFLINCSRFGGFPNRRRPKCTTMPWAIWPSLMVLWGVCWMFVVPWNDANHLDAYLEDYLGEEQARPFSPHFSLNPDLAPIAAGYDQFLDNLGSEVVPNSIFYTDYTNHGIYNDFIGNPSEQDLPAPIPSVEAVGLSADVGLDFGYLSNDRNRLEKFVRVMVKDPIGDSRAQIPLIPNQQEGSDIINHHLAPLSPAAVTPGGSQLQFLGQLSRGSIIAPEQPESPPRNAEGNYICVGFGCSNEKTFRIRSEWQTHVNQHTRPFICSVEGCNYRSATKGVLDRHKNLKHSIRRSASSESSRVSGTDRSSRFEIRESALASAHESLAVMDTDKAKAKRKFADDEDEQEGNDHNEQSTGSRMVQKNAKLTGWGSTQREEELAQENERLRQELKKVHEELVMCRAERDEEKKVLIRCQAERDEEKKERETLLGIFDRVTKQMK